jgi:hypothetical protein
VSLAPLLLSETGLQPPRGEVVPADPKHLFARRLVFVLSNPPKDPFVALKRHLGGPTDMVVKEVDRCLLLFLVHLMLDILRMAQPLSVLQ